MSRLTIKENRKVLQADFDGDKFPYSWTTADCYKSYAERYIVLDRLGQLEDVLEEFELTSAEDLRNHLNFQDNLAIGEGELNYKNKIADLQHQLAVKDKALKMASKEAWGNKASFVNSDYGKKIINAEEYSKFFIFEAEKELKELEEKLWERDLK